MTTRLTFVAALTLAGLSLAQPANDSCAEAEELVFDGGVVSASVATQIHLADAGLANWQNIACTTLDRNGVWYTFVAPSTGNFGFDTCDRSTSTSFAIEVYSGTCGDAGSLTPIGCSTSTCQGVRINSVPMTAGTRYYLQIASTTTTSADAGFQLKGSLEVPFPNDTCSGTLPELRLGDNLIVSTRSSANALAANNAEITSGDACFAVGTHTATTATGYDVAFRYVAPNADPVSFRLGNARSTTSNSVLMLTNTCLPSPGTYNAANGCVAAANRVTATLTEELSCLSLTPDAGYTLWVDSTTTTTTANGGSLYTLEVAACYPERENNGTFALATDLRCPTTGTFPFGDVDFFTLGTRPGARVYALVEMNASNDTDSQLRVVTANDTLEFDENDATTDMGSSASIIAGTVLPDAGTALRLNMNGATGTQGPYRLHTMLKFGEPKLETEPNNVATSDRGDFYAGTLGGGDVADRYWIRANAGELIFVAVDNAPTRQGPTGAVINAQLYDDLGWQLFDANDSSTATVNNTPTTGQLGTTPISPAEGFVFRATYTGDYLLQVTSTSATAMPYHVAISINCGMVDPRLSEVRNADGGIPATGTVLGGDLVTLTGAFDQSSQVFFGNTPATISARSDSELTVVTPIGNEGTVAVSVVNFGGGRAQINNGFTYVAPQVPPTVTSVQPSYGAQNGNTNVTIIGELFKTNPSVPEVTFTVGGTTLPCTNVVVVNATELRCRTPALPAGFADVTVTNPADALPGTLTGGFEYALAPSVTSFTPDRGLILGGQPITISGSNFRSGARLFFGAGEATGVTVAADRLSITGLTPTALFPGQVPVRVRNLDGQEGTAPQQYLYLAPPPSIVSVAPTQGYTSGGQNVAIRGFNFSELPALPTVLFGDLPATAVGFASSQLLTATTPAHDAGVVDVVVTNADGQSIRYPNAFTFVPAPTLTSLTPSRGPVGGGTRLTITGSNFHPQARVFLGTFPTVATRFVSATTLETTTMSSPAGTFDLSVENPDLQRATLAQAFTFDPAPTLDAVSPTSGTNLGGTVVTLTGSNFRANATVRFGSIAAAQVDVVSGTELHATTPAAPLGVVTVTVTNDDGQSASLARGWRFAAPPSISSLTPTTGDALGGTEVTIMGAGFTAGSAVTFDGAAVSRVTALDATRLRVVTPAGSPGPATIVVTNLNGDSAQLVDGFTYTRAAPQLTSATPSSALATGGAPITLIGSGFSPTVTVRFGAVQAPTPIVEGADTIRVRTPAVPAGTVDVVVTNDDGQTATLAGFLVVNPPTDQTPVVRDGGDGSLVGDAGFDPPPMPTGCGCGAVDGGLALVALALLGRRRRS